MPVELRWDGKYNADGTRRAPLRVALPFQTVETVNESAQERQWCEDVTAHTGATWQYVTVRQADFARLRPALLADLVSALTAGGPLLID
jgi:hypothetical protein